MSSQPAAAREPLILFGAGGHARSVLDVVCAQGCHEVLGLVDSTRPAGSRVAGHVILGSEADLPSLLQLHRGAAVFIAVGDNFRRQAIAQRLRVLVPQLRLATLVHPQAIVSPHATLAPGVVVMPGAVINTGCVLEEGVLVNTRASIDHDCRLAAWSSVAPGVTCGGGVRLGERSALSIGACVANGRQVAADAIIGAGAVVVDDIPACVVAYGVPCRVVRPRQPDEPYL